MDFALTQDQEELRSAVRDFLSSECPTSVARSTYAPEGSDVSGLWRKVVDLGWLGLIVPESFGGVGLGWVEASIVGEEMGRSLFPGPYASQVTSIATLLVAGNDDLNQELLPALADGSKIATLALYEGRSYHRKDINMKAIPSGDGFVIEGTKLFVADGEVANLFIVVVREAEGWGLAFVDADQPGVTVTSLPVVDRTRPQAAVAFNSVHVDKSRFIAGADVAIDRLRDRAALFLAAEQAGIAKVCLEMCISYAKTRHQFGKPIGVYQAVSHKIADMFTAAEHAVSLVRYAAWAADEASPDGDLRGERHHQAGLASWRAKVWCTEAAEKATADAIQVHGGIGFTWEHDLHMYFKRARSNAALIDEKSLLQDLIAVHAFDS